MSIKGFIFDLDGVVTDTAEYHYMAWKKLADELGFSFTKEDNERLKGVDRLQSFEIILSVNGANNNFTPAEKETLVNKKNGYYGALIDTITKESILPGVNEFLNAAKKAGIKCALASISKNAARIVARLDIADKFDYIADAALVKKPKPDPEIFLTCAGALGLKPGECIGFEDAQAGIESIHAAGMKSVGIGVQVTSIKPDLSLTSTSELILCHILSGLDR